MRSPRTKQKARARRYLSLRNNLPIIIIPENNDTSTQNLHQQQAESATGNENPNTEVEIQNNKLIARGRDESLPPKMLDTT